MKITLALFLLCFANLLFGQKRYELTLSEAILVGLENSRNLKISKLEKRKSNENLRNSLSGLYPQIFLSAQYSRNITNPVSFLPFTIDPATQYLRLSSELQALPLGANNVLIGKISLSQIVFQLSFFSVSKLIELQKDLDEKSYDESEDDLIKSIIENYYLILISQMENKLALTTIKRYNENLKDVTELYKRGLATDLDTLRAFVAVQNATPIIIKTQSDIKLAKNLLKIRLGLSENDEITLLDSLIYEPSDIDRLSFEQAYKETESRYPRLQILKLRAQISKQRETTELANILPTVRAVGELSLNTQFNDGNQAILPEPPLFFGMQISIPIFDGFRGFSSYEMSKINTQQLTLQLEETKEFIKNDVRSHVFKINEMLETLNAQEKTLLSSERIYEITKSRWKKGLLPFDDVLEAEIILTQAKVNHSKAVYQYLVTKANFERLTGRLGN